MPARPPTSPPAPPPRRPSGDIERYVPHYIPIPPISLCPHLGRKKVLAVNLALGCPLRMGSPRGQPSRFPYQGPRSQDDLRPPRRPRLQTVQEALEFCRPWLPGPPHVTPRRIVGHLEKNGGRQLQARDYPGSQRPHRIAPDSDRNHRLKEIQLPHQEADTRLEFFICMHPALPHAALHRVGDVALIEAHVLAESLESLVSARFLKTAAHVDRGVATSRGARAFAHKDDPPIQGPLVAPILLPGLNCLRVWLEVERPHLQLGTGASPLAGRDLSQQSTECSPWISRIKGYCLRLARIPGRHSSFPLPFTSPVCPPVIEIQMHPTNPLPACDALRHRLVLRTGLCGQPAQGVPPRKAGPLGLSTKGFRYIAVEGNLEPTLNPIKTILYAQVVVVCAVSQEQIEGLSGSAPMPPGLREPPHQVAGRSLQSPGKGDIVTRDKGGQVTAG